VCALAEAENKIKRAKILIALLLKLKLYISLREGLALARPPPPRRVSLLAVVSLPPWT